MDDSKILITGASGQLGQALQAKYPNAHRADMSELDITDKKAIDSYSWSNIRIILNAAGYTNVDRAETNEGRVAAWQVNALAVSNLVDAALKNDLTMVHISSDYVFDGTQTPHKEDEPFSPISVYGASKAAGDIVVGILPKHYIIRTSWLIGEGKNFVRTMLELGQKDVNPTVVADQVGRLTFTNELVKAVDLLLTTSAPYGVYNVSNGGEPASWADITREIFKDAGLDLNVMDTTTEKYYEGKHHVAPRPLNSILDLSKIQALGFNLIDWREDLGDYIKKELAK